MNLYRTEFIHPEIKITPYWLLGFVEGDGSFSIDKDKLRNVFSIAQTISQKPVLEAIGSFLQNIAPNDLKSLNIKFIHLSNKQAYGNTRAKTQLIVRNFQYSSKCLIPFFDNLTFVSKKDLDYKDWKTIANLKLSGVHLTKQGKELILSICNQMNNNRLSTNLKTLSINEQKELDLTLKK